MLSVSVHLFQQPVDIQRPGIGVQAQQGAVDVERGSLGKEISSCLQQGSFSVWA